MRILAVDTATESCSVAITDQDRLIAEIISVRRQTHSGHLLEMIDAILKMSGMLLKDADAFAVSAGPGSFTGLRIGISTVKGMVLASGKAMVGISILDVLASQVPHTSWPVCVMADARKGEVYTARYRYDDGMLKKESTEKVLSPESVISGISGMDETYLFVGKGSEIWQSLIREKMGSRALFAPRECSTVRAAVLGRLAWERLRQGDTDDPAHFTPSYIRKSDAELGFGKC